ncbi:MAG TPA: universal stress protein [Bryobacteraceae bacterium]|jgi:nucleotide-binding universal stress UspA family protein|nr:universal stress protein [Bryobacteraceae bacterium]
MLRLKKILLPVDFSDRSVGAARYAQTLASQFHSHIILLHVENDPFLVGSEGIKGPPMGSVEHTLWLNARLESFSSSDLQGTGVTRVVVQGEPAEKIVEVAGAEEAGLIVMPTRGHGAFRQFLLSSLVAKVLRDSDCPVWTGVHLANAAARHSLSFRKIACAVDLGPHARSGLRWASELASAFGALLLVIHVAKPVAGVRVDASARDPQLELVNHARGEIEDLLSKLGIKAEIAVGSGSVPRVVCDLALGFGADILVIGRYALQRRLHPDTYTMIRQSHCPVVSV